VVSSDLTRASILLSVTDNGSAAQPMVRWANLKSNLFLKSQITYLNDLNLHAKSQIPQELQI